jgi:hypothetical protein
LFRRLIPDRISEHLHGSDVPPQASSILIRYQGRVQLAVKANTSQRQLLLHTIIVREGWILRSIVSIRAILRMGRDCGKLINWFSTCSRILTASGQRAGNRVSTCQVAIKAVRHIEPIKPICGGGPNFSNGSAASASPPRL